MRRDNVFWGLFIIVLGLIFLGVNLGWWSAAVWAELWRLWPIILIAMGLRRLVTQDWLYNLLALVLVLFVGLWLIVGFPGTMKTDQLHFMPWVNNGQRLSGEQASFSSTMNAALLDRLTVELGHPTDITIAGTEAQEVTVELTGPKEFVSDLSLTPSGSVLTLKDEAVGKNFHWFSFGSKSKITGTVTVPKAMAQELKLSGINTVTLEGLTGKLSVAGSGASQIKATNTTSQDPAIDLSGTGSVKLDRCAGSGTIKISGAGKVTAAECTLTNLDIDLSGTGIIAVESGTLVDLTADVSGAAQVTLPKPSGKIKEDTSGAAKIIYR